MKRFRLLLYLVTYLFLMCSPSSLYAVCFLFVLYLSLVLNLFLIRSSSVSLSIFMGSPSIFHPFSICSPSVLHLFSDCRCCGTDVLTWSSVFQVPIRSRCVVCVETSTVFLRMTCGCVTHRSAAQRLPSETTGR